MAKLSAKEERNLYSQIITRLGRSYKKMQSMLQTCLNPKLRKVKNVNALSDALAYKAFVADVTDFIDRYGIEILKNEFQKIEFKLIRITLQRYYENGNVFDIFFKFQFDFANNIDRTSGGLFSLCSKDVFVETLNISEKQWGKLKHDDDYVCIIEIEDAC